MELLVQLAIALVIAVALYYYVPILLVKKYTVDYKKHPKKGVEEKGFLVKPDPNHALIAVQGTRVVRYLVGGNYVLARKTKDGGDSLENILPYAIPKRAGEKYNFEELGGELTPLMSFLETWIFGVTGCRFIGTSFAEILSAELASYKAKRPASMRNTTPTEDKDDKSRYVVLSEQAVDVEVKDSETGGIVQVEGSEVRSTARYNSTVQVVVVIIDIRKAFFGVDEYFPVIEAQIQSAVNEVVRGASTDDLLGKNWIKENIEHAPLHRNGVFPLLYPNDVVEGVQEYKRAIAKSEEKRRSGNADEDVNNNVLELFGFLFISVSLMKGDFDEKTQQGFERQQQAILGVQTAAREKQADELRAQGQASYTERELGALSVAARQLQEALGEQGATTVLTAQQHSRAARDAGDGVFVSLGGGQPPTPLIQMSAGEKTKNKDDTTGGQPPKNGGKSS